ncbi:MAG TPA: hypothetical protein VFL04_02520, partial [Rectinemataceae bacterium]|nr:hypothetical protein [Rectinemataceae bacterium]
MKGKRRRRGTDAGRGALALGASVAIHAALFAALALSGRHPIHQGPVQVVLSFADSEGGGQGDAVGLAPPSPDPSPAQVSGAGSANRGPAPQKPASATSPPERDPGPRVADAESRGAPQEPRPLAAAEAGGPGSASDQVPPGSRQGGASSPRGTQGAGEGQSAPNTAAPDERILAERILAQRIL